MQMKDPVYDGIAPPRLRAALSENGKAWQVYNDMTMQQRRAVIRQSRQAETPEQMRALVDGLVGSAHAHPPVQL